MSIETSGTAAQIATGRTNFALNSIKQNADNAADIANILTQAVDNGNVTATRGNNLNITV